MSGTGKIPSWHEEDHPSHSSEIDGVESPVSFIANGKAIRSRFDVDELERGVQEGNRTLLARAITLIESVKPEHRTLADELLVRLYPKSGKSLRVGVTGVPGAGKSTFIEVMGTSLCNSGSRLAVLTVDPSSELSGGSILGDKTRMEDLSRHEYAFIRPSPSRGVLGGVARWTREAMIVCEAAGFDTIFIETVGVGQSEIIVRGMVDCFLLLALPGAGDELQGIKKGIVEMADLIAVTKSDGDNTARASAARLQLERIVEFLPKITAGWTPRVLSISSLAKSGLAELWGAVEDFRKVSMGSGAWQARRDAQLENWLKSLLRDSLADTLSRHPEFDGWMSAAHKELPTTVAGRALRKICSWAK